MKGMSEDKYDEISDNFPNFLWLVRDALKLPLIDGRQISPTEYLKRRVLTRSNNRRSTNRDEIVSAILRLFPSVECRTLPRPSADPEIVTSIELKHDLLEPAFKEEVASLVDYVRSIVRVRKASSVQCCNGTILAEMVEKHVNSVNSGENFHLENIYVTAAEAALLKLSRRLVAEYKKEMEERVQWKFPMNETAPDDCREKTETLLSIHTTTMAPKHEKFQREVDHFLPVCSEDDASVKRKKDDLLLSFEREMCQQSANGAVVGGALHHFVVENYMASRKQCQQVELAAFRGVRQKIQEAATRQSGIEISSALLAAEQEYYQLAIGPAKFEVCNNVRQKLEEDSQDLIQNVPGRPRDLHSTGAARDKIKLQWVGTNSDPNIVAYYEVQSMTGDGNWMVLSDHFSEQSAIVKKLRSGTEYMFQVRGVGNTGIIGNWSATYSCCSTVGNATRGAATVGSFLGGMVACPIAGLLSVPIFGPLSIVGGVVGAPFLAGALAKHVANHFGPQGELKAGERDSGGLVTAEVIDSQSLPSNSADVENPETDEGIVYESDD